MTPLQTILHACGLILEGTGALPQAITVDIAVMQAIKADYSFHPYVHVRYDQKTGYSRFFLNGIVELIEGKPKIHLTTEQALLFHPTR